MDTIKIKIPQYFRGQDLNELRCHFVDAFCRFYENGVFIKGIELTSSQLSSIAYTQGLLYCLLAREIPENKKVISLPESCRYTFLIEGENGYTNTVKIINMVWDCFIWNWQQNEGGLDEVVDLYRLVGLRTALIEFVTRYFSEWMAARHTPESTDEAPFI